MKIKEITSIEGPNEWSSIYDQLIVLDLEVSALPSSVKETVMLLNELEMHFPSLIDYESGGLKKSAAAGTREAFLALLVELVAGELQAMAGTTALFSDTCQLDTPSSFRIVFSYTHKETGYYAAAAAVDIVQSFISCSPGDVSLHLDKMLKLQHGLQVERAA